MQKYFGFIGMMPKGNYAEAQKKLLSNENLAQIRNKNRSIWKHVSSEILLCTLKSQLCDKYIVDKYNTRKKYLQTHKVCRKLENENMIWRLSCIQSLNSATELTVFLDSPLIMEKWTQAVGVDGLKRLEANKIWEWGLNMRCLVGQNEAECGICSWHGGREGKK